MTDDELDQRVRASILAEPVDTSRVELAIRNQIRTLRRVPRWTLVAAAGLVLAIGSGLTHQALFRPPPPPLCIAAAQDHQREIVNGEPRRWLRDLSAIQLLAEKQGVPGSAIVALGTTGYRLERARLCFLKKQIFLHLVYTKDGSQYSVYLHPGSEDGSFSNSVRSSGNVAYFQVDHLTAVFVAHQSSANVFAFAQAGARVL
jgi:hypothetical protein